MRRSIKAVATAAAAVLMAGLLGFVPAGAGHDESLHSDNVKLMSRKPIRIDKDIFAQGSDLAFQGRLIVAGTYEGTGFFKLLRRGRIKQVGFHHCPGSQGDVSIWGKYVFVSVDSPATNKAEDPRCNNTDESTLKEGLRILDISDPTKPTQIKFVETPCGSHTHTLSPGAGGTLYAYIESYPLGAPTATCSPASHRKVTIVKIPLSDPTKSKISGELDVSPSIGCHDLTTFPEKDLAIAACISESQVWDISDPAQPVKLAVINNGSIQVHHSASFTWDGKYAILSDEHGGAEGGGCSGQKDSKIGAMYFYDITDPAAPVLVGDYSLPRIPPADYQDETRTARCTTHLYNILPMKDPAKYIAASSYYEGGISVVDFSDPAAEEEIGYYLDIPGGQLPDTWSAYWYNGFIFTNDHQSQHGIRVFKMKGLGKTKVHYFKGRFNPQVQIASFK